MNFIDASIGFGLGALIALGLKSFFESDLKKKKEQKMWIDRVTDATDQVLAEHGGLMTIWNRGTEQHQRITETRNWMRDLESRIEKLEKKRK